MAEQCSFYYYDSSFWSSSYCCSLLKAQEGEYRVGERWADQYCRRYNHERCPHYMKYREQSSGSTGCYLTTACVQARGLPDDCYELQTLRRFRDTFLKTTAEGRAEIELYYTLAPRLVNQINHSDHSSQIYEEIYVNLIIPCVKYIEQGRNTETLQLYRGYVQILCKQFGVS